MNRLKRVFINSVHKVIIKEIDKTIDSKCFLFGYHEEIPSEIRKVQNDRSNIR